MKRGQYRLLSHLCQLAAKFARFSAIGGMFDDVGVIAAVSVSIAAVIVAVTVAAITIRAVEFELRAIGCRRVAVR